MKLLIVFTPFPHVINYNLYKLYSLANKNQYCFPSTPLNCYFSTGLPPEKDEMFCYLTVPVKYDLFLGCKHCWTNY